MIGIESDLRKLGAKLLKTHSQIPYATARAMNFTALLVQKFEVEKQLPSKFKLRTNWWKPGTKFGVNVNFATKANIVADVFSKAPWLAAQETGGTRKPAARSSAKGNSIGNFNLIPMIGGARKSEMARRDSGLSPAVGRGKVFFAKKLKGVFMLGQFKKTKKGGRRVVGAKNKFDANWGDEVIRPKLTLLWSFTGKSIKVKPILEFQKSGTKVWQENIGPEFIKAFDYALSTQK